MRTITRECRVLTIIRLDYYQGYNNWRWKF